MQRVIKAGRESAGVVVTACVQRRSAGTREIRIREAGRPRRDAREGQARRMRKSERLIVARKRLTPAERRSLSSRAT